MTLNSSQMLKLSCLWFSSPWRVLVQNQRFSTPMYISGSNKNFRLKFSVIVRPIIFDVSILQNILISFKFHFSSFILFSPLCLSSPFPKPLEGGVCQYAQVFLIRSSTSENENKRIFRLSIPSLGANRDIFFLGCFENLLSIFGVFEGTILRLPP